MRLVVWLALFSLTLSGCSGMGIPSTPGAFLDAPDGKTFDPIETLDPRNSMVYIYRPITRWGYEEVQAPVFSWILPSSLGSRRVLTPGWNCPPAPTIFMPAVRSVFFT